MQLYKFIKTGFIAFSRIQNKLTFNHADSITVDLVKSVNVIHIRKNAAAYGCFRSAKWYANIPSIVAVTQHFVQKYFNPSLTQFAFILLLDFILCGLF